MNRYMLIIALGIFSSLSGCSSDSSVPLLTSEIPIHMNMKVIAKSIDSMSATISAIEYSPISIIEPDKLLLNGNEFSQGLGGPVTAPAIRQLTLNNSSVVPGTIYTLALERPNNHDSWSIDLAMPEMADVRIINSATPYKFELNETVEFSYPLDPTVDTVEFQLYVNKCNKTYENRLGGIMTNLTPVDQKNSGDIIGYNYKKLPTQNTGLFLFTIDLDQIFTQSLKTEIANLQFVENNVDLYCKGLMKLYFTKTENHPLFNASLTYVDHDEVTFYFNVSSLR